MKTRRFSKDHLTGVPTLANKQTVIPVELPPQEEPASDTLSARVLRTFVRPCSWVETNLNLAPMILTEQLGIPVALRSTLLNEYEYTYGAQEAKSELYSVRLLPNGRRHEAPGTLDLLFETDPRTLPYASLQYLHEALPSIQDLLGSAVLYEAANLEKVTDPLTSLLNRRGVEPIYEHLFAALSRDRRAGRATPGFAAVIVDIDHFKKINDKYGHDAGDDALKKMARYLHNTARRDTDQIARIGGEEFFLILDCNRENAIKRIEQLREDIKTQAHADNFGLFPAPLTVSCGLTHTDELSTYEAVSEEFWRLTDQRAYRAKRSGRDRLNSTLVTRSAAPYVLTISETG